MTSDLAEACATIAKLLPTVQALTAEPDTDGTMATAVSEADSCPPWNGPAASAAMDAHAGIRRRELAMRAGAGLPARHRGGSDANTMAALKAMLALGPAAGDAAVADAVRDLDQLARHIEELPAVDTAEPWTQVQDAACPYCELKMLWLQRRAGRVTCLRFGGCYDRDGNHPAGLVQQSAFGEPMVAWNDGWTQYGAVDHGEAAP